MNLGILPLGGPKAAPAPPTPFTPLQVLHVHDQTELIGSWSDTNLIYSQVVEDVFGTYDVGTGIVTIPAGQGGLYAAVVAINADGGTADVDSADIKVVGSVCGIASISGGGAYYGSDTYLRFTGVTFLQLVDSEEVNAQIYSTAELTANNYFPSFNVFKLFRLG